MRKIIILLSLSVSLISKGQMLTNDPIHTGITSLIKMFQDPSFKAIVGDIEKLKKVSSAVRQFHRGKDIITSVSNITSKISRFSSAVSKDGHIYPVEYALMSKDIVAFTKEAQNLVKDMKSATTATGGVLQMSDADRTKWLDDTYEKIARFENKIGQYFNKIQSVSIKRSASKNDLISTSKLYDLASHTRSGQEAGINISVAKNGYDTAYDDSLKIPLDYLYQTQAFKDYQRKMRACEFKTQQFYRRQDLATANMQRVALFRLMDQGYSIQPKKKLFQSQQSANQVTNMVLYAAAQDTISVTTSGQSNSGLQFNVKQFIEDEIMAVYDPTGKRISIDEFNIMLEFLAKEIYIEEEIDKKIETELNLEECRNLANDFNKIMKEAELEYLSKR